MRNFFTRFVSDESGATAVEYGLIASLISVAIVAGAKSLGTNVSGTFSNAAANITAK